MKGLQIAKDNDIKKLQYDSSKPRLQIAMGRTPPHLNLVDVTGTALVTSAGSPSQKEETLFTIYHGLLQYKPKVLVYFYVYSSGLYDIGKFFYGFGAIDDYLTFEIDERNLYIKHILADYFGTGHTSTAPSTGRIRVKYLISSNPVNDYTNGRPVG